MSQDKIKILISDSIDLSGLDILSPQKFEIEKALKLSNDDILTEYECDVLVIRSIREIDKDFLNSFKGKIIATCSKGVDHIDIAYAEKRGIKILNVESGNSISTAEHTMTLILAVAKNLFHSRENIQSGNFSDIDFPRFELNGKTVGVIGYGNIGKLVAKYCRAFGMEVSINEINPLVRKKYKKKKFHSLNYILKNCDIVSIHIPLDKKNYNFFSEERLLLLKSNAVLINTSRGEVLDEGFLIRLLREKKIYFAGLDVFKNEPSISTDFEKLNNVVLTNHIGGKTPESRDKMSRELFKKIRNCF